MKLSLCMIVKNEEACLGKCLESVQGIVDEIIVVDTGSNDKTMEVAKSYYAKVYSFEWQQNFGQARNYSLEQATGDWILCLDADEELGPHQQEIVKQALNQAVDAYQVQIVNLYGSNNYEYVLDLSCRLFRNKPDYRFNGSIHEKIYDAILAADPQAKILNCPDIKIIHYGYLPSIVKAKNKYERNIALLSQQYSETKDPFILYAIACEYYQQGDYSLALTHLTQHLETHPHKDGYMSDLLNKTIWCHIYLQQYVQAKEILAIAKLNYPDFTDLFFTEGIIHWKLKDYGQALQSFDSCLKMGEAPPEYSTYNGVGSFRAYYNKGLILEEQLCLKSAIDNYLLALRSNPGFYEPFYQLMKLIIDWSSLEEGLKYLQNFFDFTSLPFLLLLVKTLISLDKYPIAKEYLLVIQADLAATQKDLLNYYLGLIAYYELDLATSKCFLDQVPLESKYYLPTIPFKFVINWLLGSPDTNQALITESLAAEDKDKHHQTMFTIVKLLVTFNRLDLAEPMLSLLSNCSNPNLILELGNFLYKKGFYDHGISILKSQFIKKKYSLDSLLNLHRYYIGKQQYLKAEVIFRKAYSIFKSPKMFVLFADNYQKDLG